MFFIKFKKNMLFMFFICNLMFLTSMVRTMQLPTSTVSDQLDPAWVDKSALAEGIWKQLPIAVRYKMLPQNV